MFCFTGPVHCVKCVRVIHTGFISIILKPLYLAGGYGKMFVSITPSAPIN